MSLLAITNVHVVPIESEPFDGSVIVRDGRIEACGPDLQVPTGAEVLDGGGQWLLPGFVDAHVHLGMHPEGEAGSTADVNEMTDPIMSAVRAIDAIRTWARPSRTMHSAAAARILVRASAAACSRWLDRGFAASAPSATRPPRFP